jgi:hypothetical protein
MSDKTRGIFRSYAVLSRIILPTDEYNVYPGHVIN